MTQPTDFKTMEYQKLKLRIEDVTPVLVRLGRQGWRVDVDAELIRYRDKHHNDPWFVITFERPRLT